MVAANLARHLRERFADQPADWKPLVYCWRGGLRSGSMVAWWRWWAGMPSNWPAATSVFASM
jgi:hypothetical protein